MYRFCSFKKGILKLKDDYIGGTETWPYVFFCRSSIWTCRFPWRHACMCAKCHCTPNPPPAPPPFPPLPRWKQMGHFERPSSYLTTNTSRRVNYSTQQTSCFWQRGPGSECLLLLGLCLSQITWGGGTSQNQECGPNLTFSIFDCSLNKRAKARWGERRDSGPGWRTFTVYAYADSHTRTHTHAHMDTWHTHQTSKQPKGEGKPRHTLPVILRTGALFQMEYHKQSMATRGVCLSWAACARVRVNYRGDKSWGQSEMDERVN